MISYMAAVNQNSKGTLYRNKRCGVCEVDIEQEIKNAIKKQEMMSVVTSGRASMFTMEDEDAGLGMTVDEAVEPLRFYKCGCIFHLKCLKNHLNEMMQKSQFQGNMSKV